MGRPETASLFAFSPALVLLGCASVDPTAPFEATRALVADRHPGEIHWLRDEDSRARADTRTGELLAAPHTLDSAAELALLRNPRLQATLEELGIAQADLAQATRLSNPGVSFATLSGSGQTQRTIAVSANLVDWLVQPLRRRVAQSELERTRLEVGNALLATVADARSSLVRYQAALELVGRLEEIAEIDGSAAEYARALFDAGNLTALERARFEAAWGETRAALQRARRDVLRRHEEVSLALGLDGSAAWRASAALRLPAERGFDPIELQQRALADRLDLAASRWAVDLLERALASKRRTRYFPVGVEVGVERERETDGVDLTGPTVELRLPLFDTGKASIARLSAELSRARWQLRALEAQVRSSVREQASDLEASRELVVLYRDTILPLRREVVRQTLLELNQMLVGTFDLLVARKEQVEAERLALEALAEYWLARVELERAVGSPLPRGDASPDEPHPHHHHHDDAASDGGEVEEGR